MFVFNSYYTLNLSLNKITFNYQGKYQVFYLMMLILFKVFLFIEVTLLPFKTIM